MHEDGVSSHLGPEVYPVTSSNEKTTPIRLALIGNVANNFFREAYVLREASDFDVTCFLSSAREFSTEDPSSDVGQRSDFSGVTLASIPPVTRWTLGVLLLPKRLALRLSKRLSYAREVLSTFDACLFSGPFIPLSLVVDTAVVIRPTGADLTVLPIVSYRQLRSMQNPNDRPPWLRGLLLHRIQRRLLRKSYQRANAIASLSYGPFAEALQKIGVDINGLAPNIPLAIALDVFKRQTEGASVIDSHLARDDNLFLVFLPSRLIARTTEVHLQTGYWKGSDIALKGFAEFANRLTVQGRAGIRLVIPDRYLSPDIKYARELVLELGIADLVIWARGSQSQGLTRAEMIPIYSMASATMDDFGPGWFGSVVVEAFACESPVITYLNSETLSANPGIPALNAQTSSEIADRLEYLFNNREVVRTMGLESRSWVSKHHSAEAVSNAYRQVIGRLGMSQPKGRVTKD